MTCDGYKFRDEHSECFVLFIETSDQNEDLLGKCPGEIPEDYITIHHGKGGGAFAGENCQM